MDKPYRITEIERLTAELLKRDAIWLPEKDSEIERLRAALEWYAEADPIELYRTFEIIEYQRRANDVLKQSGKE